MSSQTAKIIDGKALAAQLKGEMQIEVDDLTKQHGRAPGLAVIMVGDDPASHVYVKNKKIGCEQVGIVSFSSELPASTSQEHLLGMIAELNKNPHVDGILVQFPMPDHISEERILNAIAVDKDVDGFHPYNIGCLAARQPELRSCTPYGCLKLIESTG
ncbi:MAG: tetrahydrofolate dehydrogenase/cyclohydrolase catalytic domain-containing protein, partial [Ghiorsea sp.]